MTIVNPNDLFDPYGDVYDRGLRDRLEIALSSILSPHGKIEYIGYSNTFTFSVRVKWVNNDSFQIIQLGSGGLCVDKSVSSLHWAHLCANAPRIGLPLKHQGLPTVFYHNQHTDAVYVELSSEKVNLSKVMDIQHENMMDLLSQRGFVPIRTGYMLARTPYGSSPYALVDRYEVV